MKPRVLALLGAFALTAGTAVSVLAAAPPGNVTIESNGCAFTVHIDLDHAYDLIGWKVKQYNAVNWNEGLTLFKGSGPTDGDGKLDVGPFTAPEGHYTVAVDDEYPPDGSSIVVDFVLSCPAASSPTGSEQPISSGAPSAAPSTAPSMAPSTAPSMAPSTAPSEMPTGSELPISGSPAPSGAVEGVVGTPAVTPPPTDTAQPAARSDGTNWQIVVAFSGAVGILAGLLATQRVARASTPAANRIRRRR